ncbi:MAG: hypothetical protein ACI4MQ_06635 [Candidatus Coproplasma sp.]
MERQFLQTNDELTISEYENYLEDTSLKKGSKYRYKHEIEKLISDGYSLEEISGSIYTFIKQYSKGGDKYDPNNKGNTVAALKYFAKMLIAREGLNNLCITRTRFSPWIQGKKYIAKYIIKKGNVEIYYKKDNNDLGVKNKVLTDKKFVDLVLFIREYKNFLAKSKTGSRESKTDYVFGQLKGVNCSGLFQPIGSDTPVILKTVIFEWIKILKDLLR